MQGGVKLLLTLKALKQDLKLHRQLPLWAWPSLLIAFLLLTPVLAVTSSVFTTDYSGWLHLIDTVLFEYIGNSLLLMLGSGLGVLIIGVVCAWLVSEFEFVGRRSFEWLLLLPLAMPAYIIAYTYAGLLDFYGPVQSLLRHWFSWSYGDYYFPEVRSIQGAMLMMSLVLYPYVYLLARTAFLSRSASLTDAAKTLGAGPWRQFYAVALPIARPAIIAGLALALMEVLADYGTVQYFGVSVLSTGIFRAWFGLGDIGAASQLATVLLVFVVVLLVLERRARRSAHYVQDRLSQPHRRRQLSRTASLVIIASLSVPLLLGFILPFMQLLYWLIVEADQAYDAAFWRLFLNSLMLAATTSVLALLFALMLAYLARALSFGITKTAVSVAGLGYAIPGTVIAVGVLMPFAALDHVINDWYGRVFQSDLGLVFSGGFFILIFAYLVRFMAVALSNMTAGYSRIPDSLDAAAKTFGEGSLGVFTRVHLPLLKPSIFSALLLVFVDTLKELPATLVLRPFDFNTLAVRSYELANDEQLANAAPSVVMIVLAGLIPVILLNASIRDSQNEAKL